MPITYTGGQAVPTPGTEAFRTSQIVSDNTPQNVSGNYNPQTGEVTTKPVSSVVSSNGSTAITDAINNHKTDLGQTNQPVDTTKTTEKTVANTSVEQSLKDQGGYSLDEVNSSGLDTTNYTYDPATKYFLPKKTPDTAVNYDSEIKDLNDAFSSQKYARDLASQNLIKSIKDIYDEMKGVAEKQNATDVSGASTLGLRLGGRYAPGGVNSLVSKEQKAGLEKIKKIGLDEANLVASAEQNLQQENYQAFMDNRQELDKLRNERTDQLTKIQDRAYEELKAKRDLIQKEKDNISSVSAIAAKNGATREELTKISSAKSYNEAIALAGDRLQEATGDLGKYIQYKRDAIAKGLTPLDYTSYQDQQDAKASQLRINEENAKNQAKQVSDAAFTASDKNQQKLEQQARGILSKEFSARTGALGVENAKVNQANHLNSLITQYYDPKTGNYNVPKSQYGELVLGLANLISPTSVASDKLREEINTRTAKGDIAGAISYVTGSPMNGSTQDIIKNFIDSIDRQAETAVRNREAALQNMRDQLPTDLEPSRQEALLKSTNMVRYEGQDRISKKRVNDYIVANPTEAENIAKLYEVPGATDQDIEAYLKAQGKIQ